MTKENIKNALLLHEDELIDFLANILSENQTSVTTSQEETIQERTAKILRQMNMPQNLDGFQMIVNAIELLNKNPRMSFDQELYPTLAGNMKNKSRVERVIRYAISYVLNQPDVDRVVKMLGYCSVNEISTNRKFILALLHTVR